MLKIKFKILLLIFSLVTITHANVQSWGLDRIDQRNNTLDNEYKYKYTGRGVHVYVIDSGIRYDHDEFKGRVGNGIDFVDNDDIADDCTGHGTHVSGIIAGTTYGVAKEAIIHPVKILNCNNQTSHLRILSAIDWILENHIKPAVVNMSLVGNYSEIYNDAVSKLIEANITIVVAAGNDADDACSYSPASESTVITVASSSNEDEKSYFSNTGRCVDLFAPGSDIRSAGIEYNDATETKSGTSMAAPHVTGVVSKYLQNNPNATPSTITNYILNNSTKNKISDLEGYPNTPNKLLYGVINLSTTSDEDERNTIEDEDERNTYTIQLIKEEIQHFTFKNKKKLEAKRIIFEKEAKRIAYKIQLMKEKIQHLTFEDQNKLEVKRITFEEYKHLTSEAEDERIAYEIKLAKEKAKRIAVEDQDKLEAELANEKAEAKRIAIKAED
jgi:hypothetical protein